MDTGQTAIEAPVDGEGGDLPNLRHLRLFEAAVRLGSLTRAAELVHVSQPAASQAVARLSRLFGARLAERTSAGLRATSEGMIVHSRAARALAHLAEANRRIALRVRQGRGALAGDRLERHATMAQLRALSAFAEAGSFSDAARRLGQTEPAVQRAAREIERLLGVALFDGGPRDIRLTPAGDTVATQAALALREVAAAHEELREARGVYDGRIVIGTLPLARTRVVPLAVVDLMQRYPDVRIEIVEGRYDQLVQSLRSGACDVIVGALREAACPAGVIERPLFQDRLSIVARAAHPLAGRTLNGPELAAYPWVLPRAETPTRAIFDRLAAGRGICDTRRGHVETGSLVMLRGVLLASDAVSIISARQIDYELRQGLLVELDFAVAGGGRPIGVTVLEDWRPTAAQAAFVGCLEAVCAAEGPP